jgi:hypothetical protein
MIFKNILVGSFSTSAPACNPNNYVNNPAYPNINRDNPNAVIIIIMAVIADFLNLGRKKKFFFINKN